MVTYTAPDETPWAVHGWVALEDQFGLKKGDLPEWHTRLSATALWDTLRQIYGIGPAWDLNTGEAMSIADVAQGKGVPQAQIQRDIESCVTFWQKRDAHERIQQAAAESSTEDPLKFRIYDPSVTVETAQKILQAADFPQIPESLRIAAASRVLELKRQLQQPATRLQVKNLIQAEVTMATYSNLSNKLQSEIDELLKSKGSSATLSEKRNELTAVEKRLSAISEEHLETLEKIGADELEVNSQKKAAVDTVSYMVESMMRYYGHDDHALVDGVFTEGEMKWLLTPVELYQLRPAQYRAEIVASINGAMESAHVWNPNYDHTKASPTRDDARLAKRVLGALIEAQPPRKVQGIDDVKPMEGEADEEDEDSAENVEGLTAGEEPLDDESSASGPPTVAIPPAPYHRSNNRDSGEFGAAYV